MRAGDTYIRAGKHIAGDPHLWVVISNPLASKSLVVVNVTSQRNDKDQSCVILPGEHPFIAQESVIMYAGARVVLESQILAAARAGALKLHSKVSQKLLTKIRHGAVLSTMLPLQAKRLLQAQSLLPPEPGK